MKKLLIVVDMEGVGGIGMNEFWSTIKGHPFYFFKRHLIAKEVNAAIEGAVNGGIKPAEIIVADWHLTHHNIRENELPKDVSLIRDNENDVLDNGVEKVFLIGFHAGASFPARYAHSFKYAIKKFEINSRVVGETTMWAYNTGSVGIPIAFLSGDSFAVQEIKELGLNTISVETKDQSNTPKPETVCSRIREGAERAISKVVVPLSSTGPFSIKFSFKLPEAIEKIPIKYFSRREREYIVIDGETAHKVYGDLRKLLGYIRDKSFGYKLMSFFEK